MKESKKESRYRRARKTRAHIAKLRMPRLSVFRASKHIYAQIIAPDGNVIVSASTVEPEMRAALPKGGNVAAAKAIGERVAQKAIAAGVESIAFDRSGYRYHGRVQALADAAREAGLKF
jgi:large subunit ribosomal protein L18